MEAKAGSLMKEELVCLVQVLKASPMLFAFLEDDVTDELVERGFWDFDEACITNRGAKLLKNEREVGRKNDSKEVSV